jgi:hypothetical protein
MDLSFFRRFLIVAVNAGSTLTFSIQPYVLHGSSDSLRYTLAVQSDFGTEVAPYFLKSVDDARKLVLDFLDLFSINEANVRVLEYADLKVA